MCLLNSVLKLLKLSQNSFVLPIRYIYIKWTLRLIKMFLIRNTNKWILHIRILTIMWILICKWIITIWLYELFWDNFVFSCFLRGGQLTDYFTHVVRVPEYCQRFQTHLRVSHSGLYSFYISKKTNININMLISN